MSPIPAITFFRQLKGAPIALLMALLYRNRPTGRDRLVRLTGYSAHTVQQGLAVLAELDLARRTGYREGWIPTAEARRTVHALLEGCVEDGIPGAVEDSGATEDAGPTGAGGKVQNIDTEAADRAPDGVSRTDGNAAEAPNGVAGAAKMQNMPTTRSSSCLSHELEREPAPGKTTTTTTTTPTTRQPPHQDAAARPGVATEPSPALDADAREAVALLHRAGCPVRTTGGKGALDAVLAARAQGWSGAEVLEAVEGWLDYAASSRGRTITHRGFFAASRLRLLEKAPAEYEAPAPPDADAGPFGKWTDYVTRRMEEIVQR